MAQDKQKILVVDDFEMVRKTLRSCLNQLGHKDVAEAGDGKEALDLLVKAQKEGKPFTLLFVDLNMPTMNGIDLLKACKNDMNLAQVPFVMISAESERAYVVQSLQQGASEYIIKPFSAQILQKKIQNVTRKLNKAA